MQNQARILVVDDEPAMQLLLRLSLQKAGYTVQTADTGLAALDLFALCDLVLLDARLPDVDGFVVCAELRKRSSVPIVMLTALSKAEDILRGFNVGVDDYIVKPYRTDEVIVRLRAILRRSGYYHPPLKADCHILAVPGLLLNDTLHKVWVRGMPVDFTPLEYQLLRHLMSKPNRPSSKNEICRLIWQEPTRTNTDLVENVISHLRKKIELDPSHPRFLLTIRAVGYLFSTS